MISVPKLDKGLQETEYFDEGDPNAPGFPLVQRCRAARRVPVGKLAPHELRLLLGQKIGMPALTTIALERTTTLSAPSRSPVVNRRALTPAPPRAGARGRGSRGIQLRVRPRPMRGGMGPATSPF